MVQSESVYTSEDFVNYTFHISSKGAGTVAGELLGLSNTVSTLLGDIAFKTSEMLSHVEILSMGTSAAIGAMFVSATKSAIHFEQQMANVKAIGGESLNAQEIGNAAMEYSSKFGMATESMTEGLESLARAGITTTSVMKGVLEEGVKLSKLEGMDLEDSINDLISTTNLLSIQDVDMNSAEYAEMVKQMNQHIVSTSESAPINAQNIIQSLQHVGGYASAGGIDQDDLFAVIAQLGSRGTKGEMAGTALRAFIAAGQKDTAQRALARIGLNVSDLWNDNGETMLSISEMKDVLDDALEARGYSKQEKLEFYSDFAGYKQANQIMKINTSEVAQYKEQIANAWDLGTKLNTILGTVRGNLDRIRQLAHNFMTKVGSKILFMANALLTPVRMVLELINKMPFADTAFAAGMVFVGFTGILKIINNIVPRFSSFFIQLSQVKKDMFSIKNIWRQLPDDIDRAIKTLKATSQPKDLLKIQQEHQLYSTREIQQVENRVARLFFVESNWDDDRFGNDTTPQQKKAFLSQAWDMKDDYYKANFINNLKVNDPEKWATAISDEIEAGIKHGNISAQGTSYDIGEIIGQDDFLKSIDKYVALIWGAMDNSPKSNRERNAEDRQAGFRNIREEVLNNRSEYGDYNYHVSIDGMPQFKYDDINEMRRFERQVKEEIRRKQEMYADFFDDSTIESGRNRLKKSLTIAAKTDLGYEFSTGANTSDIKHILETGNIRSGSSHILNEQLQTIADILETDTTGDVNADMRRFHNILNNKSNKDDLLKSILDKTQQQWNDKYYQNGRVGFFPTQALKTASGGDTARKIIEKVGGGVSSIEEVQEHFKNVSLDDTLLNECVDIMYEDRELVEKLVNEEIKYMYQNLARVQNSILNVTNSGGGFRNEGEYKTNLQKAREYVLSDFNPKDFSNFSESPNDGHYDLADAIEFQNDDILYGSNISKKALEGYQGFIYPIGTDIAKFQREGDNFQIRNIKQIPYNKLLKKNVEDVFFNMHNNDDIAYDFFETFADWVTHESSLDGHYWSNSFDYEYSQIYNQDEGSGFEGSEKVFDELKGDLEEIYRGYIKLCAYGAQSLIEASEIYGPTVSYRGGRFFTPDNDFGVFDTITSTSLRRSVANRFWHKNPVTRSMLEIYNPEDNPAIIGHYGILNDQNSNLWAHERELTLPMGQPYLTMPTSHVREKKLIALTPDQQKAVKEIMGDDFEFKKNQSSFRNEGDAASVRALNNQLPLMLNKDILTKDNIATKLQDFFENGSFIVGASGYGQGFLGEGYKNGLIDIRPGVIKYFTDTNSETWGEYGSTLLDTVVHEMTHILMMHEERQNYQSNNIPSELGIDNFEIPGKLLGYSKNFVAEYEAQYVSSQVLGRLGLEVNKKDQDRMYAFEALIKEHGYENQIQYELLDQLVEDMLDNISTIGNITESLSTQWNMAEAGITSAQVSEDMRPLLTRIQAFNNGITQYTGPTSSSKGDNILQTLSDMEDDMEILWNSGITDESTIEDIIRYKYSKYTKALGAGAGIESFLENANRSFMNKGNINTKHITQPLTTTMIMDLLDNNPDLEEITLSPSVYNRTSKKYIDALQEVGVDVNKKYNWGAESKTNGLEFDALKLLNQGLTPQQIAQQLNISRRRAYYLLSKTGANFNNVPKKHNYDEVQNLLEQGLSAKDISNQLGIPLRSVYHIKKQLSSFRNEGDIDKIWRNAADAGDLSILNKIKRYQLHDPLIKQIAPIFYGTWGDKRFNSHINQYLRREYSYADFDLFEDYLNPEMKEILTKYNINTISSLSTLLSKTLLQTQGLPFDTRLYRRGHLNTAANNFGILTGVTSTAYEVGPTDAYQNPYGGDLIEILAPAGTQGMNLQDWEYTLAPNTPYVELGQYGEATRILLLPPKQQNKYGFYPKGLDDSYRISTSAAIANNFGIYEDLEYEIDGAFFEDYLYDNERILRALDTNGLYHYYNHDNDTILTSEYLFDLAEEIDEDFISVNNAILDNFNNLGTLSHEMSQNIISNFIASRLRTHGVASGFRNEGEDIFNTSSQYNDIAKIVHDSIKHFYDDKETKSLSRQQLYNYIEKNYNKTTAINAEDWLEQAIAQTGTMLIKKNQTLRLSKNALEAYKNYYDPTRIPGEPELITLPSGKIIELPTHAGGPSDIKQGGMNKYLSKRTAKDIRDFKGLLDLLDSDLVRNLNDEDVTALYQAITLGEGTNWRKRGKELFKGDTKVGDTGVLNITTAADCINRGADAACEFCDFCYAWIQAFKPNVTRLQLDRAMYFRENTAEQIAQDLRNTPYDKIRISQEGDFRSLEDYLKVAKIAELNNSYQRFYGYTKVQEVLDYIYQHGTPENLQINNSLDTWDREGKAKGNYIAANWNEVLDFLKRGYALCQGACEDCKQCLHNIDKVTILRNGSEPLDVGSLAHLTHQGQIAVFETLRDYEESGVKITEKLAKEVIADVSAASGMLRNNGTGFRNEGESGQLTLDDFFISEIVKDFVDRKQKEEVILTRQEVLNLRMGLENARKRRNQLKELQEQQKELYRAEREYIEAQKVRQATKYEEERQKEKERLEEKWEKYHPKDSFWDRAREVINKGTNGDTYYFGGEEKTRDQNLLQRKAQKWGLWAVDKTEGYVHKGFNKISNFNEKYYDEKKQEQLNEKFSQAKNAVNKVLEPMKQFNDGLERAAEIFPPLAIATTTLNTVIQASEGIIWGLEAVESLLHMNRSFGILVDAGVITSEQALILNRTIETAVTWGLTTAMESFYTVILPIAAIIIAIVAAIEVIKIAEKQHAEALKKSQKALEEATAKNNIALSQYKDLKKARESETDAIKRQKAARKEAIALYELEAARIKRHKAIYEEAKLRNDKVWGEYGMRADYQKMSWFEAFMHGNVVGLITKYLSGDFESQYENYAGSTGEIRRIRENATGTMFADSNTKQVAAWYDTHYKQLGQIESFAPELQKLYDVESRLIEQYGSKEDARASKEFREAVQEFADATGLSGEIAGKYLDYLQTEANVENARNVMQAEVTMITAQAEANAMQALYGDTAGMGDLNTIQDSMVYATANEIFKDAYNDLYWKMLMEWLNAIYNVITLHWGEAGKHAKAALAYQDGMHELTQNQNKIVKDGFDAANADERKNYGNEEYGRGDTPFGAALESAALMEDEWAAEKAFGNQSNIYNATKSNGQAAVQGFKDGLNQHSPGDIAMAMATELDFMEHFVTIFPLKIFSKLAQRQTDEYQNNLDMDIGFDDNINIKNNKFPRRTNNIENIQKDILYQQRKLNTTTEDIRKDVNNTSSWYASGHNNGDNSYLARAKNAFWYDKGFGLPPGVDPNDPAVQEELARRQRETITRTGAHGVGGFINGRIPGLKGTIKTGMKTVGHILNPEETVPTFLNKLLSRSGDDFIEVSGTVVDDVAELGAKNADGILKLGTKGIDNSGNLVVKNSDDIVKGTRRIIPIAGDEAAEGTIKVTIKKGASNAGKAAGKSSKNAGKLISKTSGTTTKNAVQKTGGELVEKGISKGGQKAGGEIVEKAGSKTASAAGKKAGGKGVAKAAGKTLAKAAPLVGPFVTAAFSIAEHNPFEKHYNEDGSEKRALQSTGEVVGEVGGAAAAAGIGLLVGAALEGASLGTLTPLVPFIVGGVEMAASLVLEPVGKAVGGLIGWAGDELFNGTLNAAGNFVNWLFGGDEQENNAEAMSGNIDDGTFTDFQNSIPDIPSQTQTTGNGVVQQNNASVNRPTNIIHIHNININTEDDPEKIKSALMNLIIEMQEQITPRTVARTVGEAPAAQSTSDTQNENNDAEAEGIDPNSGTPNGNSNTNPTN